MNTFYLDTVNRTANFIFDFDIDIINDIKKSDYNARWNDEMKQWIAPINSYSRDNIKRIINIYNFTQVAEPIVEDVSYSYEQQDTDFAYLRGLCDSKDFAYTPRKYQLEALGYALGKGNIINGDDVGLGKCEYINNRVFTPTGRQTIGSLKVGDKVIGSNGQPINVTATYPQKELKKLYRVIFNDKTSVLVSGDHLFTVMTSIDSPTNYTLTVDQMLDPELLVTKNSSTGKKTRAFYKTKHGSKWRIPITKPIEFNKSNVDIDPYLLGIILGDGHITSSGSCYVEVHKDDYDEIFNKYEFIDEIQGCCNKRKASIKSIKQDIKNLNLIGKKSHTKFIPDNYKYNSVKIRLAILQGLMDSDRYCEFSDKKEHSTIIQYYSTSEQLADDVIEIVQSLGGIAKKKHIQGSYKKNNVKIKCKKCFTVTIKLKDFILFRLKRKADRVQQCKKFKISRYIKDISFERYDKSICISVDAPDRLYLTENAIVTHNTFESIMYAEVTNSFPCLVIVPASVKYNWEEKWLEITKSNREISVITSNEKKNNWQAEVCIINYDIIGKKQGTGTIVKFPELVKNDWKMIIFDEAHYLKEKRAQRSQAAKSIVKRDAIIQLLTGTAVMSKPVELWNLLILCKQDDKIAKDWHQFITRYCGGYRGKFGWVTDGATNTLELNKKLRESCYIRREKRDVLSELPDVTKEVIQVPITNKRAIKSATDDFIKYIKEAKGDEAADKAMEAEHLVAIGVLRKLAIEGKVKAIDQFLKDWKQAGLGKLVIFGIHREPLQVLSQKYKSDLIAGGTTAEQKQAIVKRWISNDELFLFANIQSAGTGVDGLQNVSSDMIIVELPWRPSDLTQTIGRLDRSGQKNATTIRFLLNETTIDQQMWEMLEDKEQVTEAVNKGIDVKRSKSGLKAVIKKILNK